MESLFNFILILIIIYFSLKLIARYVLPWLMVLLVKKLQKQQGFYFGPRSNSYQQATEPEGKVTVQYQEKKKDKTPHADKGEYVDFEDVK